MFRQNQQTHNDNKGNSKQKRKQRRKRREEETKIGIEIKDNQINNINYNKQSYNDNEITNRERFNDEQAFDKHTNELDKEKDDDSGEETDIEMPTLDPHFKDQASDSESDSESDNGEQKPVDHMKIKSGFLNKSSYKNKDIKYNNNKKKKRKKGKPKVKIPSERETMITTQRRTKMRVYQVYQAYKNVIDLTVRARMMRRTITITMIRYMTELIATKTYIMKVVIAFGKYHRL